MSMANHRCKLCGLGFTEAQIEQHLREHPEAADYDGFVHRTCFETVYGPFEREGIVEPKPRRIRNN